MGFNEKQIPVTTLDNLEIDNYYVLFFPKVGVPIPECGLSYLVDELDLIIIKEKLKNTILIKFVNTGHEKWFSNGKKIALYDHVSDKLIRKMKLKTLEHNV